LTTVTDRRLVPRPGDAPEGTDPGPGTRRAWRGGVNAAALRAKPYKPAATRTGNRSRFTNTGTTGIRIPAAPGRSPKRCSTTPARRKARGGRSGWKARTPPGVGITPMQGRVSRIQIAPPPPIRSRRNAPAAGSTFYLEPRLHLSKSNVRLCLTPTSGPDLGGFSSLARGIGRRLHRRSIPPNAGESAAINLGGLIRVRLNLRSARFDFG